MLFRSRAVVVQEINDEKAQGQVRIDGDVWSAKSENFTEIIPENAIVEILKVEGVKVIVRKVDEVTSKN